MYQQGYDHIMQLYGCDMEKNAGIFGRVASGVGKMFGLGGPRIVGAKGLKGGGGYLGGALNQSARRVRRPGWVGGSDAAKKAVTPGWTGRGGSGVATATKGTGSSAAAATKGTANPEASKGLLSGLLQPGWKRNTAIGGGLLGAGYLGHGAMNNAQQPQVPQQYYSQGY